MNIKKDILWRVYISFFLIAALGTAVVYRIIKIQNIDHGYWKKVADSVNTQFFTIQPTRGNIYADDGSLLLASIPKYDIRMDFKPEALTDKVFYGKVDSLALCLSRYFKDRSYRTYRKLLIQKRKEGARYYLIKRNVSHNQLKDIKKFPIFRRGQYKGGLIIEQKSKRIKPFGELASRMLGFKNENIVGVGMEGAFNSYLQGESGKRLMQKVSDGQWIPINKENELEPEDGKDIYSTIDINIQDLAERALLRSLEKNEADHGCTVVMEVHTGKVKAIANLKRNSEGKYYEKYNYAIGESVEPGSTFKLISALVLLKNDLIKPSDSIETGNGEYQYYDRTMRDAKAGGFGTISFKEAIAFSSNVAVSKVVFDRFKDNPQRFIDDVKELGINKPLGLPILGEGKPVVKETSQKDFSGTTLPWMSIGYEVRMTPLQMLTVYNAVANNGKMVKPLFATEVKEVGKSVEKFEPEILKEQICSHDDIVQLNNMLMAVVEEGTAKNIKTDAYKIAGKTGTSQVATKDGYRKDENIYQASFVGYFPADNPKYSIIVVINNPTNGVYYGSWVAGPVFREISDKLYANYLDVHPKIQRKSPQQPKVYAAFKEDAKTIYEYLGIDTSKIKEKHFFAGNADHYLENQLTSEDNSKIPNVKGLTLTDALYILENKNLRVQTDGSQGRIANQSLYRGQKTAYNKRIKLAVH